MAPKTAARSVRVPFRFVNGQLTYFYGGPLPTIKNGAIGDLVLPAFDLAVDSVREALLAEKVVPLLDASTPLVIRISNRSIPRTLEARCRAERLQGHAKHACVRILLLEPLLIRWRGAKLGNLEPAKCEIPALPRKKADSLNHAYRLVSEAFEPHRRSHSANVFQEVFFECDKSWLPLEVLRSTAEKQLESSLILGPER
jgi:hypothetical protein